MTAALVFLHGGCHSSTSWSATIAALTAQQPGMRAIAVDLPGRGGVAGELESLTLETCGASVAAQIDQQLGPRRPVVLVGHSLAGVVIPQAVARLEENRFRKVIFVACCLPPDGRSVIDTVPAVIRILARQVLRRPVIDKVPYAIARFIFGNRASPEQRAEIKRHLCPESTALITGACATSSLSSVPSGWILPLHDRALPPRRQRRFLRGLDRLEQTVTIDAGHEVLITHPEELARCILAMVADC